MAQRVRSWHGIIGGIGVFLCAILHLEAASPALSILLPRGAQRGKEVEVVFHGERLGDAQEVLFYEPGVTTVSLNASNAAQLKVRLKLDVNARLGQHVVRVRTAGGITEARTFSVGQYPVVDEIEPNNDFAQPQKVALNSTVHGVANNEDIDYYQVEAKKGQRITAEVEAMRLGSALVDCHVAILDRKRFELAASDDSSLALQDPIASVVAPEDGTYVVSVRESSYAGSDASRYRLHLGEAPRPTMVYPAGGKAGEELRVTFLGDVSGVSTQSLKLPLGPLGDYAFPFTSGGLTAPSPNFLRLCSFGNVLEQEPNNEIKTATPTSADLPLAFNGIIEKAGDVDFFRFKAKAGQRYDVRCVARGIRSPLDSVLTLHKADGGQIADNDDSGGPDSAIAWTVPADGEYLVGVRDHLGKGGPHYVYRVEFHLIAASLSLGIPEFARNSQERNAVAVPRGNRFATLIKVARANFGGDVRLSAPQLPAGVRMDADVIAGNVNEVPVVFEASADAPLSGQLIPLFGQQVAATNVHGGFVQSLELVYGEPNNTIYYKTVVDRMAVAVTEEAPFSITVTEPKVPLVQNGSMGLKVVAARRAGFKGAIRLRMLWNPPGVGSQNEVVIPEGQSEAVFPVNANDGAAVRAWRIAIQALADAGKGTVWTSSQLFTLNVAAPYVALQIPVAAGEQGKPVAVLCKLQQLQPFDGEATVQLFGLPPKVQITQNPLKITKDSKEVIFNATLAPDAPVGQHKSLFCQVVVTQKGEPIAQSVGGGGVLRIDPPPPPKPNAPPPPAPVVQVAQATAPKPAVPPPPPKPLSRLEKLRLEARERARTEKP